VNQIAVKINLKWLYINHPFHVVGKHLMFSVTTTRYIPWVEFVFPTLRFGWLYIQINIYRVLRWIFTIHSGEGLIY